jgi:seryl-tRNA synthetase
MFDLKWIREHPDRFDAGLARRGQEPASAELIALDAERRRVQTEFQTVQKRRNERSKAIGAAKAKGEDATEILAEVSALKAEAQSLEQADKEAAAALDAKLLAYPNLPAEDVPDGLAEADNVEIRRWGEKPALDCEPRNHFEIGEAMGLMDFERAAKLSGSRFVVLSGALARLERALAAFMLDIHTGEFGYTET